MTFTIPENTTVVGKTLHLYDKNANMLSHPNDWFFIKVFTKCGADEEINTLPYGANSTSEMWKTNIEGRLWYVRDSQLEILGFDNTTDSSNSDSHNSTELTRQNTYEGLYSNNFLDMISLQNTLELLRDLEVEESSRGENEARIDQIRTSIRDLSTMLDCLAGTIMENTSNPESDGVVFTVDDRTFYVLHQAQEIDDPWIVARQL